ncbi:D-alanine--D-alanine ligase [Candidatus Woesebacteria bacterium]|nr:D-alanine--D-alanine ligase [Candidatus Woesebacteria bacterium]
MTKLRIAVLYGGKSPEHEVSIITAVQAMASMSSEYETIPVYVTKTGEFLTGDHLKSIKSYQNLPLLEKMALHITLPSSPNNLALLPANQSFFKKSEKPFDVIFPAFHGGIGEGGWIQGLAEFYGVPLVGTGLTGAALGMDKVAMKGIFDGADIKQAPYIWFYKHDWETKQTTFVKEITTHLKFPIFVKPSRGGSSIGTTCAKNTKELIRAIDLASAMDSRIVVEEGITGAREINISVMGNAGYDLECSVCEEVFHEGSEFLDFKDKYLTGEGQEGMAATYREIPAKIDKSIVKKIEEVAKLAFNLLDCSGLARLDFLVKGKEVYCIEINTIPGSFSFYIWDKCGYPYPKLLSHLVELALDKHKETQKLQTDFASPILEGIAKGGKLGGKLSPQ